MKFGLRTPSPMRSIKARTTGKVKRAIKKSVNPFYGKKGMGIINDPQKAVYNAVYSRTTIGTDDIEKFLAPTNRTEPREIDICDSRQQQSIPERPTLFDQKLISSLNNEAFTAYANDVLEYLSFLSKHPSANEDEYTAFTDMLQFLNEEIDRRKARGQIEKPKAKPKAKPASKKMMTVAAVIWGILFVTALLAQTYWFIPVGIIFLLIFAARIKM